ncbi:hypothetical protein O0L34_g14692 [Tuta absoluta]|nr:hypothetical protein O0L34_g14692 [Tuta absoluta]
MAEKKIHENPLPDEPQAQMEPPEPVKPTDKPTPTAVVADKPTVVTPVTPARISVPSFTKTSPNDMYRRLLPAVLFLLTFVTVMTMLLVYMDTVALGAQQFRLNMSRDYELARIPQESPPLVAYVRQLHLAPRAPHRTPPAPAKTDKVLALDKILGDTSNGTFIEFVPRGPRDPTTAYLEAARRWDGVVVRAAARDYLALRGAARTLHACLSPTDHPREVNTHTHIHIAYLEAARRWDGVVVRAAARDYLALRGAARTLHACLSPTDHPREVTYHEADAHSTAFSSRVLCLPLYTVLLAAEATRADYVIIGGEHVLPALSHVPFNNIAVQVRFSSLVLCLPLYTVLLAAEATRADYVIIGGEHVLPALSHVPFNNIAVQVLEVRGSDPASRNKTTSFLSTRNYTVAAIFEDGVMYTLQDTAV